MKVLAAVTQEVFDRWSAEKQRQWIKEHPSSKLKKRVVSPTGYKVKEGEAPKRGVNWAAHERFKDVEHHRRHAKSHRIAQTYLKDKAQFAYGKGKRKLLDQADLHRKWAERHEKMVIGLRGKGK